VQFHVNHYQLKRAGVVIESCTETGMFVVQSKFFSRYRAVGPSRELAYRRYLQVIQEPEKWLVVGDELFSHFYSYRNQSCLYQSCYSGFPQSPAEYWNELIDFVWPSAYSPGKNDDIIGRLYAYSEWCCAQVQPKTENFQDHLRSSTKICFYELIHLTPEALSDLPNWFEFEELKELMEGDPFMENQLALVRKAFGLA